MLRPWGTEEATKNDFHGIKDPHQVLHQSLRGS